MTLPKNYIITKELKDLLRCQICDKPFVEAIDKIAGKKTGHIFKPDCDCQNKDIRISVG